MPSGGNGNSYCASRLSGRDQRAYVGRWSVGSQHKCPKHRESHTSAVCYWFLKFLFNQRHATPGATIPLGMIPIQEIKPEHIRAVIYVDTGTPGRVNSVKLITEDGHIHVYDGDDLAPALALAKQKFPAEPGSTRMADQ